jgi:hypothetical protein
MSYRRLGEGAPVVDEPRDPGPALRGMEAVDEIREGVKDDVLAEGHGEREPSVIDADAAARRVVGKAEHRAVEHVDRESGRAPAAAARHRFPENRNV